MKIFHHVGLKSNSRLNTSNSNNFTKEREVSPINGINKEACIIQGENIKKHIIEEYNIINDNSVNIINEYVIYNSFKNIFKSNKISNESNKSSKDYKCSQNSSLQIHIKQVHDKIKDFECNHEVGNSTTLFKRCEHSLSSSFLYIGFAFYTISVHLLLLNMIIATFRYFEIIQSFIL